jgi:hypothetical protein
MPVARTVAPLVFAVLALVLAAPAARAHDEGAPAPPRLSGDAVAETLAVFEVKDSFERSLARVQAASQGTVSRAEILRRPSRRAGEVLETVPGVVVSQHSGEGKANQYYLRGFNLDHGTDFSTTVAGVPVNLPTHGHGQGYTDLSFVVPELVSGIQYRKGPYYADDGDFSTAGGANLTYRNTLERPVGELALDRRGYGRALVAASQAIGRRRADTPVTSDLLYALEAFRNDGPWDRPDDARRLNGMLRYSRATPTGGLSISATGYDGRWNSTDQIPSRAFANGSIGRFGFVDPTDGGRSSRATLSGEWQRVTPGRSWRASAYVVGARLDLWSNFTYFLDDTVNGDQFEQVDERRVYGFKAATTRAATWRGRAIETSFGVNGRFDDIAKVGLYATRERARLATTREDAVGELAGGGFAQASVQWTPRVRAVVGLRGDAFAFDVRSDDARNSGFRRAGIVSPKLALLFGPFDRTAYFVNAGLGFHSNDARGTTTTVDAKTGAPVAPVDPLVRTRGAEIGARTAAIPNVTASAALWILGIDSELLFVGDAGTTEASRASERFGVEWTAEWRPTSKLALDAQAAWSRARFTGGGGASGGAAGDRIPGALERVLAGGVSVRDLGPWFASVRVRSFGPRALVEDGSVRSEASTLLSAQVGYKLANGLALSLQGLNLTNAKASNIESFYASRLPGEAAEGVEDDHFHPVEPFTLRLALQSLAF